MGKDSDLYGSSIGGIASNKPVKHRFFGDGMRRKKAPDSGVNLDFSTAENTRVRETRGSFGPDITPAVEDQPLAQPDETAAQTSAVESIATQAVPEDSLYSHKMDPSAKQLSDTVAPEVTSEATPEDSKDKA